MTVTVLAPFESADCVQCVDVFKRGDGDFSAEVEIGADGNPVAMAVFKSPDPEITKVVSDIVLLSSFKPARCKGVPCAMAFPFHIAFKVA